MRKVKLKKCPFCGFSPNINDDDCIYPMRSDSSFKTIYSINCYETGGGCGTSILGNTQEECIEKWNNRSDKIDIYISGRKSLNDLVNEIKITTNPVTSWSLRMSIIDRLNRKDYSQ